MLCFECTHWGEGEESVSSTVLVPSYFAFSTHADNASISNIEHRNNGCSAQFHNNTRIFYIKYGFFIMSISIICGIVCENILIYKVVHFFFLKITKNQHQCGVAWRWRMNHAIETTINRINNHYSSLYKIVCARVQYLWIYPGHIFCLDGSVFVLTIFSGDLLYMDFVRIFFLCR